MTYLWVILAFVVLGGASWYIARHKRPATDIARVILLFAGSVTLLVTQGLAQRVVAAGLVGLVLGDVAAKVTEWSRSEPQPDTD